MKVTLRAAMYDEVLHVGEVDRLPATGTCMRPVFWLYELLRLTYDVRDLYKDFNDRLRAVTRTSHAATGYGRDASLERVDRYFDALPMLKNAIHAVSRPDMRKGLKRFFASKDGRNALKKSQAKPSRLCHDIVRASPGRSPFVTKKGHLGLTSQFVRQGDIIALVGGAQVPFILRNSGGRRYAVVSEAYVDGIMDGEAAASSTWEHIELV